MKKRVKKVIGKSVSWKKIDWTALIACFIFVYIVGYVGGVFTQRNVNSLWYKTIKPVITPPDYLFPIVWTVLFILIALSLYFTWTGGKRKDKETVAYVYSGNFMLNILWTLLYFGYANITGAFIGVSLLWVSIVLMIYVAWEIDQKAAWMLVPYLAWVSFAVYLNYLSLG